MKPKIQGSSSAQELAYKLIAVILLVFILFVLRDILIPLIFAGLLSFILFPVCDFLEKRRIPRMLSIILALILLLSFLGIILYFAIGQILDLESLTPILNQKAIAWLDQVQVFLKFHFNLDQTKILKEGQKYISEILKNGSAVISNVLGYTSNFLVKLSLLPLYIFLFLMYRDFLKEFVFKLFKNTGNQKIQNTIDKIVDIVGHYIVGLIKVIFIIGLLNTAALLGLRIEHAVFFGFFAAVLVLIPYIGIIVGAILPILVALITKDSYLYAIGVAIAFYVVQFLEGNFITPYVVGNKISINPLIAIISLLLFGTLWGVAGLVLALPLTAVLKVIFDSSESTKAWGFLLGDVDSK
jgi:predicted PurR-regulated permease PerM